MIVTNLTHAEALFDADGEFSLADDAENPLRIAVLGGEQSGQRELLNRFLTGEPPEEAGDGQASRGRHKNPLQLLSGVKAPQFGKKRRTEVPVEGAARQLLFR